MGRSAATAGAPPEDSPGWAPRIVLPGEQCDHRDCPSTVQVSITVPGGVLGFCGHHGRECYRQMISRGIRDWTPEQVGDLKVLDSL